MEILINPEFKDKDEIISHLESTYAIQQPVGYNPTSVTIDISMFLRPDKSLNLELIEIAIESVVKDFSTVYISGLSFYYEARSVTADDKKEEECVFIYNFIKALVDEYKDHNVEVILA